METGDCGEERLLPARKGTATVCMGPVLHTQAAHTTPKWSTTLAETSESASTALRGVNGAASRPLPANPGTVGNPSQALTVAATGLIRRSDGTGRTIDIAVGGRA